MITALALIAALTTPAPKATVDIDRMAIAHVVTERNPGEHVTIVIVHDAEYAIASGHSPSGPMHDGLRLKNTGWRIVCAFSAVPASKQLASKCEFPATVANEMAANLAAEVAAQSGDFNMATIAEERAFASAKGPERDSERARVQYLTILNEQMRTGMITRQQAIQKWGEFRFSWALP